MIKKWELKSIPDTKVVNELSKSLQIDPKLSALLSQRGISTFNEARQFFRPSLKDLHDPFRMKDMERAVNRLCDAIHQQEKILIYGDYDVDGTTSVAMMYSFLRSFTEHIDYYIPDRYTEGYGISEQGVKWAHDHDFSLIIALDCGIRAMDEAQLSKKFDVDLIICDHHLPGPELPEAFAILDPKRPDCAYPFKELSGCGVGFKLLHAFCIQNTVDLTQLFAYLDLIAVSIASDIVPMIGENRILAYYGLKKINADPSPGLKALVEVSTLKSKISISDIVFYIGPRINATGRLSHARESVKLLIATTDSELKSFADQLNQANSDRREFDRSITEEALEMISEEASDSPKSSTVLFKSDWHKGVIGIVASRCIEHYYRPTIILTESNGMATGSARSVNGFDVHEAIASCSDLLDKFGGHKYAAGLTLSLENIESFREKFDQVVADSIKPDQLTPRLEVDLQVDFAFINFKSNSIMDQMAPFGPGNMQPTFLSNEVYLRNPPKLIKEEHLKLSVYQKGQPGTFEAIAFGLGTWSEHLKMDNPFAIVYHIEENEYQGNKSLQLVIKDIKNDF
ncbi:MAG: single-stranded-DNA-specific exonuclease RecJ [Cyclobacteriaceae bacterium]|nr:single-stranded-DNA-specific exonuclease RecJ [Cyclobacteriaceae bacterium HetDA_MAG_MS6]